MTNYSEQFTQYFSNLLSSNKKAIDLNKLKVRIDDFQKGLNGKSPESDDIGTVTANSTKEMIDEFINNRNDKDDVLDTEAEVRKFAEFWRSWDENNGNGNLGFIDPRGLFGQPTVTKKAIANPEDPNEEISINDTKTLAEAGARNVLFNPDQGIDTGEIDFITTSLTTTPGTSTTPSASTTSNTSTSPSASTKPTPSPKVAEILGQAPVSIRDSDILSAKGKEIDGFNDLKIDLPNSVKQFRDPNKYYFVLRDISNGSTIRNSTEPDFQVRLVQDGQDKAYIEFDNDFDPANYQIVVIEKGIDSNTDVATIPLAGEPIKRDSRKTTT